MEIIKKLRNDAGLTALLSSVSDVEILPEFRAPEDECGRLTYSMAGRTFAESGAGSEYILLEDGTVGYWGSEGECGRLAESLEEFFAFVIRCPYWQDYLREDAYRTREALAEFAGENYRRLAEESREFGFDLPQAQRELLERLGIETEADITDILFRFYRSAKREPRLTATYREDDGSTHSGTGSVFDR